MVKTFTIWLFDFIRPIVTSLVLLFVLIVAIVLALPMFAFNNYFFKAKIEKKPPTVFQAGGM
ncbi:hypothetical protein ACGRL8_13190 [Vibrio rumoiensis]|uniref:hypothetical protein n=1 Tax=Vibrio rumoiensis TaxID=76258 RepID=UPI00374A6659